MRVHIRRRLAHEVIVAGPGHNLIARHFRSSGFAFLWHQHPEFELTLIRRGAGRRFVADQVEPITTPELVLIGPQVPHTWQSQPSPAPSEAVVVQFAPDWLGSGWSDLAELRPVKALLEAARAGVAFAPALAAAADPELVRLAVLSPGPERLGQLLLILARLAQGERRTLATTVPVSGQDRRWTELLAWIQAHADEPLSQRQVATRWGLSATAFAHAFRRRTGLRFTDHLARLRLGSAARALLERDGAIAEIAFTAGFGTLAAFNRRFKAAYGCTPTAYRQRVI